MTKSQIKPVLNLLFFIKKHGLYLKSAAQYNKCVPKILLSKSVNNASGAFTVPGTHVATSC